MSVTVRIPTVLRKLTGDQEEIEGAGATVAEVLGDIGARYPEFVKRIYLEDGKLRPFLNVFVNGDDIRFESELDTSVADGDEISIVPSLAGG